MAMLPGRPGTLSSSRARVALALYVIPSLDMVVYKMSSLNGDTYDPAATGLPLTYTPDISRDNWKPHPLQSICRWSDLRRRRRKENAGDGTGSSRTLAY